MTIFEIEADLINKTNVLYSDYLNKMVADINQKKLVAKKREYSEKGINSRIITEQARSF